MRLWVVARYGPAAKRADVTVFHKYFLTVTENEHFWLNDQASKLKAAPLKYPVQDKNTEKESRGEADVPTPKIRQPRQTTKQMYSHDILYKQPWLIMATTPTF